MPTREELIDLIVAKAGEHHVVPWELLGGAIAESSLNPSAWRQGDWPDWSAGLFQQTVMYADEGDHTSSPENAALIKSLYFDPVHACDVAAEKFKYWRYDPAVPALTAWVAYNSPGFYQDPESSPNVENYRAALAEARRILGVPMPDPVYDPNTPIVPQNHGWDCSEQSTLWAMTAFGRRPSDAWMEAQMIADGVVSPAQGLLDASGAGLAAWITAQYAEFGYAAHNNASVSFDDVVSVAGSSPVMIGGHNWGADGHWVGVRGYDRASDELLLANPADGYPSNAPIHQTMTRRQFSDVSPCSMVVVTWGSGVPIIGPATDPATDLLAQVNALTQERDQLKAQRDGLITALADVCDRIGDQVKSSADQMRATREQFVGPRS